MNLEFYQYLYLVILYITGSLLAVIMTVEVWGAPTSKGQDRFVAYALIICLSWIWIFVQIVTRRNR